MTRAYRGLMIGVLGAALLVAALARLPHTHARAAAAAAPLPVVTLSLATDGRTITPEASLVPKDHRVSLTLVSRARRPVRVALAGYEDRVSVSLEPGRTWRGDFVADLPGEGFAWLVNGEPAGRLAVTGSHLVEGHR